MPKIVGLEGNVITDSRGDDTVEVLLRLKSGAVIIASVPQGKSVGTHEAVSLPARDAKERIERVIAPAVTGRDVREEKHIDELLIKLDGTECKERLGANAMLAVSIAVARAAAEVENVPLWKRLRMRKKFRVTGTPPRLLVNLIEGGMHASNRLMFQEYLALPRALEMRDAVRAAYRLYEALEAELGARGIGARAGDEGGFAPNIADPIMPLELIAAAAVRAGEEIDIGLDAAANAVSHSAWERETLYVEMAKRYPFTYLEDPCKEDEFVEFAGLKRRLKGVTIVGDDLTTTNLARMERARKEGSIGALIVKPNQIGTVEETLNVVTKAQEWGWGVYVSHRSGETRDDFIADLAYGCGADGIKLGTPSQGERLAKYERLLTITVYEE